ncbi:SulP family inorganic anion transporter [Coraliomargarita parva]|uniref:SulP family inorganic anion transporter n=1 Tax=Coraliomargarita parva TaxID=3014050 RepID=UPI0022B37FA4|nr:SulP family inorganic anion transporter [Coraliomargarita parva]
MEKAIGDARAALNVALLDFPQSMAYALIAGLPVQIGIFGSALSTITGPIMASSRFIMLGPSNATAVMLLSAFLTLNYSPEQAVLALPLLLLLVGVFMILGAFLRVASMVQYVSRTVITGYITAAAFLIIVNQLKTVLGLHVARAGTFAESLYNLVRGLPEIHWEAFLVGALTVSIFIPLKRFAKGLPTVAVTLVLVSGLTAWLRHLGVEVEMLKPISASNWPLSIPHFNWNDFYGLSNAALAVAFLSLLESSSISKTLAAKAGDQVDLNQQMLSMGMANFACAFGSGMAVSGSLTRSVLNFDSRARTPISSVMSGVLLILGLFLLGRFVGYVPKPALASVVIMVGISLINMKNITMMVRTTKSDAAVFFVTLIGGMLLPLDTAIYLGATASIVLFMRKAARPDLKEIAFDDKGGLVEASQQTERPEIAIVHVEGDLFFASSDLFLEQMRHLVGHPNQRAIILRMRNAHHLDATVAITLKELIAFAKTKHCAILVSGAHTEVERIFQQSGLMEVLGEEQFFRFDANNINMSTRNALKRAQSLTGVESADITIFASDKKD